MTVEPVVWISLLMVGPLLAALLALVVADAGPVGFGPEIGALLQWMLAPPSERGGGTRRRLRTRLACLTRENSPPPRGAIFGLLILIMTLVLVAAPVA